MRLNPVRSALLPAVILFSCGLLNGEPLMQTALQQGFAHFYSNEYDQALDVFQKQAAATPEDPMVWNAVAQAILYRQMYRSGSLESQLVTGSNAFLHRPKMGISQEERHEFQDAVNKAISISEVHLKEDPKDVPALYAVAVAHGLRANFLFSIDKSLLQALRECIAARKVNDQILELDPSFVDAHLLHGLSEYVVSCLPAYLRMLGTLNGFHPDKEDGIKELQLVAEKGIRNRFDGAIILAAIYRREKRPHDAIPLLQELATQFPRNYLFRLEQVQMYSDLGDKGSALRVLAEIEAALRGGKPGYAKLPLERVRYARGNLLFWYNDLNSSLQDLKEATRKPDELDLSTATMAWLRLGQVYDLLKDRDQAIEAYRMAVSTAPASDIAKEASDYMDKPYKRKPKNGAQSL
jgi:tetratricopeptide (TPR) repeat protein